MVKVSIIINVYNGATTLQETIESVLAQSYADWDLIIWDDCSTDKSAEVISSYDDPRIHYFRSENNCGLGPSRIAALEHASGEWVGFLDQDDLWTPDKLALQLDLVDSRPNVGFVYGRALRFYTDGTVVDYDHRHEFRALPDGDIFERLFIDSCFIAIGTVLFRRSAFQAMPPLPTGISACPDYYMYLAFARQYDVAVVQEVVCLYRMHSGNMSHTYGLRMQREILQIIDGWAGALSPQLTSQRRKIHSTVLAVHQLRSVGQASTGLKTLLMHGDLGYLLCRPVVRGFRAVRRKFRTPYWARAKPVSQNRLGFSPK